jgi:hypothetical protein
MAIDLTQVDRASRLEGAAVAVLGASFRGELILPGDQRYDDARRVWNGMVGGIGWLARKHGTACDNLLAADLVTAGGES